MSSFTDPIIVEATPYKDRPKSWRPPAWIPQNWVLARGFTYAVGCEDSPKELITVPKGFVFNGHSVPVLFLWLLPRAHPIYLQAAALHDWLYADNAWPGSRRHADDIYFEALRVLAVPKFWVWAMWVGVRLGGWFAWRQRHRVSDGSR